MPKGHSLQAPFLNTLRKEKVLVAIYLVSGIKLQGQIESFYQLVIVLKNTAHQMLFKYAISTVLLNHFILIPMQKEAEQNSFDPGNNI